MPDPADRRQHPRHPVDLRVRVAARDEGELADRYAANFSPGGLFLRTSQAHPVGTLMRLELVLTDGRVILRAKGEVRYVATDGSGMGIRFIELDPPSKAVFDRILVEAAARRASPLASDTPFPPAITPIGGTLAPEPTPNKGTALGRVAVGPPPLLRSGSSDTAFSRSQLDLPGLDPAHQVGDEGPIIGIDLGTTYSCAGFVRNGKPVTLLSREGYSTIPSIIALNGRGKLVVGHPAQGQMLTNPRQTVYGSKRLVGRPFESPVVQESRERFLYDIVEGPASEAAVKLGGAVLTLQEIAGLILKEVRDLAQNTLGRPVHRAVITCPAHYNEHQREAVREAGRLAGLKVERILNEPTAAALAYGYGKGLMRRILIYDLGGGTFDASVLDLHGSVFEVVSTGGDTFLGGVDFDNRIVDHLLSRFEAETGRPFGGDQVALQRILDAAERAKRALSEQETHRVHVPFVTHVDGQPLDLDVTLDRQTLEELSLPLVDRTLDVCQDVLAQKNLLPNEIDDVILVGGMSRMPLVRRRIREFFGKDPHKGIHPDEAVAMGAALLGHSMHQAEGVVLIDVLPMSIAIGMGAGRCQRLIERNTSLPVTKTIRLATNRDNQTSLDLNVFQGESDQAAVNEFLGTLTINNLPPAPRGVVKVAVTFHLTAECLLTVTAREEVSGQFAQGVMSTRSTAPEVKAKLSLAGANRPVATAPMGGMSASDGRTSVTVSQSGVLSRLMKRFFGQRTA